MGENITIHGAYDAALKELGEQNRKIVGLETDVVSSAKSGIFGRAFPERYFNMRISELDMVSMSAGFAREGLTPFVNIFTVSLTTRGADPIQSLIVYDKLNVELCGTYYGPSDSYDGASHQTITDLAFAGAIFNTMVITMAGAVEARGAVFTITDHQGPVYLRLNCAAAPVYYSEDMKSEISEGITARDDRDVTIIIMGIVLYKALAAAELLKTKGIQARVMGMHTIEPIDGELVIECARETGATVIVEERSACGGLGSTVAEVLTEHMPAPMTRIGATNPVESGDYEQFLARYGYGPESTAERCAEMIKRKQTQKSQEGRHAYGTIHEKVYEGRNHSPRILPATGRR